MIRGKERIETENQIYLPPSSFPGLSADEQQVLAVVQKELQGWNEEDLPKVLSTMAEDATYWDVTMEPAYGLEGIREFGEGWLVFCPDFGCFVESLVTQGDTVVSMGWITGHPNPGVEWFPGMISKEGGYMDFPYCQVAKVRDGKIYYVRDHWDSKAINVVFEAQ
jgi:ketosteroid isomerase-like protein